MTSPLLVRGGTINRPGGKIRMRTEVGESRFLNASWDEQGSKDLGASSMHMALFVTFTIARSIESSGTAR